MNNLETVRVDGSIAVFARSLELNMFLLKMEREKSDSTICS